MFHLSLNIRQPYFLPCLSFLPDDTINALSDLFSYAYFIFELIIILTKPVPAGGQLITLCLPLRNRRQFLRVKMILRHIMQITLGDFVYGDFVAVGFSIFIGGVQGFMRFALRSESTSFLAYELNIQFQQPHAPLAGLQRFQILGYIILK